MTERSSYLRR
uniref:Uncharacterized protein n=1 Tax=Arundo donax TaxID=35708 RepID=A0A0A8Y6B4_ARUDO